MGQSSGQSQASNAPPPQKKAEQQEPRQRSWWEKIKQHWVAIGVVIVVLVIVIVAIGGYFINWNWTGFEGKTLWDWLGLLAILAIPLAVVWFTHVEQKRDRQLAKTEKKQEKRAEEKDLLRKLYSNIVQAYNAAKKVRRLLRGSAQCISPGQTEIMIMIEPYDKQMQALVDVQLHFEFIIAEIDSNPTLFPGPVWQDTKKQDSIISKLNDIEHYLNVIVKEYEDLYKKRPNATPTLPISELERLEEFMSKEVKDNKFFTSARDVRKALHNLLTSEESNQTKKGLDQV